MNRKKFRIAAVIFSLMLLSSCGQSNEGFEDFGTVVNNESMEAETDTDPNVSDISEETAAKTETSVTEGSIAKTEQETTVTAAPASEVITDPIGMLSDEMNMQGPIHTSAVSAAQQPTTAHTTLQTTVPTTAQTTVPTTAQTTARTTVQTTAMTTVKQTVPVSTAGNNIEEEVVEEEIVEEEIVDNVETVDVMPFSSTGNYLQTDTDGYLIVDDRGDGNYYLWFGENEWKNLYNMSIGLYFDDGEGYIYLGNTFYCYNGVMSANGVHGIRLEFDGYWYCFDDGTQAEVLMDIGNGKATENEYGQVLSYIPCQLDNIDKRYYLNVYLNGNYNSSSYINSILMDRTYSLWDNMLIQPLCAFSGYQMDNFEYYLFGSPKTIGPNSKINYKYCKGNYMFVTNIYDYNGNVYRTKPLYTTIE